MKVEHFKLSRGTDAGDVNGKATNEILPPANTSGKGVSFIASIAA